MQGTGEKIMIVSYTRLCSGRYSSCVVELTFIILANRGADFASLPMVGDVNVFLKGDPCDEDFEAEVGVMIAGM